MTKADAVELTSLIRTTSLAKAFGPTKALRDCSFELRPAEIHAVAGENGSGKSTLVKIISGVHTCDAGSIEIADQPSPGLRHPHAALEQGIVTVFQEVLAASACSVLDNVWLGVDRPFRTIIGRKEKRRRAAETLDSLLGRTPNLNTALEDMSLSDRQACCIARALVRRPRVLILDEATSALDVETRDRLFTLIRELSREGAGIVLITHRMDEINEIADRVTVMRSGETIATLDRGEWTTQEIVRLMTGSTSARETEAAAPTARRIGDRVLSTRGLKLQPDRSPISFDLRAGELVGLAGLEGHGQNDFLHALRGIPAVEGSVVRVDDAHEIVIDRPRMAAVHDIAYVPRERRRESIFEWMSTRENFAMPTLKQDTRRHWLSPGNSRRRLAHYVGDLGIVLRDADDRITTLSGGNQQKVIVARWLAANPKILLLNDPTRGIDVNAKHDLYRLLTQLANEGLAIVMLSTELDEHVDLMDRVLVFREYEVYREIRKQALSRDALVSAFFGDPGGRSEGDGTCP
jgi:ABC-type sugar transport system ATPase subunit